MSTWQAPCFGVCGYVLCFSLLSSRLGTVSKKTTDKKKLEEAERRKEFYKPFMLLHNIALSLGSLVMLLGFVSAYTDQYRHEAAGAEIAAVGGEAAQGAENRSDASLTSFVLDRVVCDQGEELFSRMQFWLYVFYLSKFYEFLDTVFLCLTMRKVIPLHWIHHVLTCYVAWIGMEARHTVMGIACLMNTAVHVVMYGYYAYKLIDPSYEPWWKQHLTKIQMRQFMVNVVGLAFWTYMDQVEADGKCAGEMWVIYVVLAVMVTFLAMFAAFANSKYSKKKGRKQSRPKEGVVEGKGEDEDSPSATTVAGKSKSA